MSMLARCVPFSQLRDPLIRNLATTTNAMFDFIHIQIICNWCILYCHPSSNETHDECDIMVIRHYPHRDVYNCHVWAIPWQHYPSGRNDTVDRKAPYTVRLDGRFRMRACGDTLVTSALGSRIVYWPCLYKSIICLDKRFNYMGY